ncbi:MAG: NAD-dependent epimerase/dehydratase family protein [Lachnospiraceae bacterium]|nr:NAD-dependent epimerase/dehydratase family protein [Lachnospiraceae bacterium]
MRVVLLGGSGFIGTNVALGLKNNGYEVVVLDRVPAAVFESAGIDFVACDYVSGTGIEDVIREGDCVIHLVSTSLPNMSNQNILGDAENNLIPSIKLFDVCIKNKASKIIYASSGGQVYGIPEQTPIDENHPTNPQSAYGIHKLAVEKYLMLYSKLYDIKVNIMRISNPYGPGQQPFRGQGVISTFIASSYMDKTVEIWGDGKAVRDYIYIDDLVDAFVKTVDYAGCEQVFNVGSGEGSSVLDILTSVENATCKTITRQFIEAKSADVNINVLNCDKAQKELGWRAKISLDIGVEKMTKYWNEETKEFQF